ncbi:hypothetical protein VTN77DRAFT_8434 [Rasamsonia byssochlamydoides]|uniref:uncharacterized protein n=1 Tax=Rasamsonia byssochlamydoides TaxID=89139 RepID=UPI003744501B
MACEVISRLSAGIRSLETVQTRLLIALFELQHAIRPNLTASLQLCAQVGSQLGFDGTLKSDGTDLQPCEQRYIEEERRTCYINAQLRSSNFAVPDPEWDDYLPMKDSEWENENVPCGGPISLRTSFTIHLGAFACQCQAAFLLGQVLMHINDTSNMAFKSLQARAVGSDAPAQLMLWDYHQQLDPPRQDYSPSIFDVHQLQHKWQEVVEMAQTFRVPSAGAAAPTDNSQIAVTPFMLYSVQLTAEGLQCRVTQLLEETEMYQRKLQVLREIMSRSPTP